MTYEQAMDYLHGSGFSKEQIKCIVGAIRGEGEYIKKEDALKTLEEHKYSREFCAEHGIDFSINMEMVRILLNRLQPYSIPDIEKIKSEIIANSQTEEIFDEETFNSTYSESYTRESAECESIIETEVIPTYKVLAIIDKHIGGKDK